MPISLLAAEAALLLLVVYLAILLWLDFQHFLLGTLRTRRTGALLLHLAWSVPALVGIPFRCRWAWRLACAASAFLGMLGVIGGVFILILAFSGMLIFGNSSLAPLAIWSFSAALYMFVVYYCLGWPTSVTYFGNGRENEGSG